MVASAGYFTVPPVFSKTSGTGAGWTAGTKLDFTASRSAGGREGKGARDAGAPGTSKVKARTAAAETKAPTRRRPDAGSSRRSACFKARPARTAERTRPASSARTAVARGAAKTNRSEEHTSELQSRENLVCRLL